MAIHDQGYRRYGGHREPHGTAWTVIAMAGLRAVFRRRALLAVLLFAWAPFFVRAVQIYAAANFPQAKFLAPTADTFRQFLQQQGIFVFVVSVFVGAGLIANDRRANALQLYLSKPLTRADYVAGKAAILASLLLFVTWVPALLLLVVQMAFAGNLTFLRDHLYLFPAVTVFAFLEVTMITFAMLALSSLSRNSRFVGIMYTAFLFFSQAIVAVLAVVTGGTSLSWISFSADLTQIGDAIFHLPLHYDMPWPVALLMVLGLMAASCGVLAWRVRGVEVVT
ncbi:MAG TPA: ABC-2 transporter permease [Vicinamibacterales bacterium]|nr:ABC-2 transporter permease [Vicinamibacterales bacterium]